MSADTETLQDAAESGEAMPPPRDVQRAAQPIGKLADNAIATMLRRAAGDEKPIATPWRGVNKAMRGGLWPGLYTLTSGTGTGKTQWAVQVAVGAAQAFAGTTDRVRYIALELGGDELVARVLGELAGARWSDLLYGRDLTEQPTADAITAAAEKHGAALRALPLDVETADAIGWTYGDLQKIATDPHPPRLVVLDYTQLVCAPKDVRAELRETIGAVAKVARDLARRRGLAVLALCSTARENYEKTLGPIRGHTPRDKEAARFVALGKESGELEYTADVVMALTSEREEDEEKAPERRPGEPRGVWVALAKGRGFPVGWARLLWDGTRFYEEQTEAHEVQNPFSKRSKR